MVSSCSIGTPISGRYYPMLEDIPMQSGPGAQFAKTVNQKATAALGRTIYQTFSRTQVLAGRCATKEWLQGQIVESTEALLIGKRDG